MMCGSNLGMAELTPTKAERPFRDGAVSIKLLTLIDQVLYGVVDILAGTGRTKELHNNDAVMGREGGEIIDCPDGWVFAFEGGAHILFRYTLKNPRYEGKLLRLAKRNKHTLPILKKHQAVQDTFLPLLTPDNGEQLVVHTDLVRITKHVLDSLQSDQVRTNTKRNSELDLEESHGTLLEDLSADPSILLLDFKPKWLSQSPTAPPTANTCRTCALRRLRRKAPKSKPRFCPLDLSSGCYHRVHRAVTALLQEKHIQNEFVSSRITKHLLTSKLIPTLLKAQTSPECSLATRMTLRDCTLFVQVPRELFSDEENVSPAHSAGLGTNGVASPRPIRIIIADLDEKSEEIRGAYWKSLEQSLITGRYYLGEGKLDVNVEDCDLTDDVAWMSTQTKQNGIEDS